MDTDNLTIEEKCETLMCIVVESRKRFKKLCIDYNMKSSLMENKILNSRLEKMSKYQIKSKLPNQNIKYDEMYNDMEEFTQDIEKRNKYLESLKKQSSNTESIVRQLKSDHITKQTHQPLTTEVLLARAKNKVK